MTTTAEAAVSSQHTTCVIAGCGPAGAMLGLLLARAGIDVTVLEKHGDFLRDFRGDTIHPSTLQVLAELGLLEGFLDLPHQKMDRLDVQTDDGSTTFADLTTTHHPTPYIAMVPQWDFLDFITREAFRYPTFHLLMNAEVYDLIEEAGKVRGLRYRDGDGHHEVRAELTVATDGRHSTVRHAAGLKPIEFGAPMDVLWLRVSRKPSEGEESFGRLSAGRFLALIRRTEHWQIAYVFIKGSYEQLRARGIDALRDDVARLAPFLADRVGEIRGWDEVPMLKVQIDRLRRWYRPGLLCIGDAAHAMSPVAGVGINLAVQDAVATANLLTGSLRRGKVRTGDLARVQLRRWVPTAGTQAIQRVIQHRVIRPVISARDGDGSIGLPAPLRLLGWVPGAHKIPPRFIGVGILPEHVRTPQCEQTAASADLHVRGVSRPVDAPSSSRSAEN